LVSREGKLEEEREKIWKGECLGDDADDVEDDQGEEKPLDLGRFDKFDNFITRFSKN